MSLPKWNSYGLCIVFLFFSKSSLDVSMLNITGYCINVSNLLIDHAWSFLGILSRNTIFLVSSSAGHSSNK